MGLSTSPSASIASLGLREPLTANKFYYVSTTGSDSNNNGLTVGAPFLTIQKAVDVSLQTIDAAGQGGIVIFVAEGTYTGATAIGGNSVGSAGPFPLVITSNAVNAADVVINVTSGNCFTIGDSAGGYAQVRIDNIELRTTTSGNTVEMFDGSSFIWGPNIRFGPCAGIHVYQHTGGYIRSSSPGYTISGGAIQHLLIAGGGVAIVHGITITFENSPAFNSFVTVRENGLLKMDGVTFVNGGTVTGTRYDVSSGGYIHTAQSSLTYLPGSLAGSQSDDGYYDAAGMRDVRITGDSASTSLNALSNLTLVNTSFTNNNTTGVVGQNSAGGNVAGIDFVNINQIGEGSTARGAVKLWTNRAGTKAYGLTLNDDAAGVIKLDGYTTDGFVKTSSSDGTLSVDTTAYSAAGHTHSALAALALEASSAGTTINSLDSLTLVNTSFTNQNMVGITAKNSVGGKAAGIDFITRNQVADGSASGDIRFWTNNAGTKAYMLTLGYNRFITFEAGTGIAFGALNVTLDTTTGTKWGVATTQKQAWWNSTPVVQPTAVADASGGTIMDIEARAQLNNLLARLRTVGMIAT